MREIIGGKLYDTDKAELLGCGGSKYPRSDFRYYYEELYRTKKGQYFLAGTGGPMTHYCVNTGDGYTGGEKIIPISEEQAKEWAELHLDADEYINIFGDSVEEA